MTAKQTKSTPPSRTSLRSLTEAAELLKTIAHPHRLRIIQMLLHGRYTVGELAEACGIPGPMASEHLRLMLHCGLLDCHKEGRKVYYRVKEPQLTDIIAIIERRFGFETC